MTIALLYHLGVPGRTRWRHEVPGAVVATGVWLGGSAGLRLYGTWILDGGSVYGSLAGPIVLLLWLWLTGFAVLLGAELNSQLAYTGAPGERRSDDPTSRNSHQAPDTVDPMPANITSEPSTDRQAAADQPEEAT
jgi:uncharacterized BrkB/YihY/UPF0761 family membrane protein